MKILFAQLLFVNLILQISYTEAEKGRTSIFPLITSSSKKKVNAKTRIFSRDVWINLEKSDPTGRRHRMEWRIKDFRMQAKRPETNHSAFGNIRYIFCLLQDANLVNRHLI